MTFADGYRQAVHDELLSGGAITTAEAVSAAVPWAWLTPGERAGTWQLWFSAELDTEVVRVWLAAQDIAGSSNGHP